MYWKSYIVSFELESEVSLEIKLSSMSEEEFQVAQEAYDKLLGTGLWPVIDLIRPLFTKQKYIVHEILD